MMMNWFELFSGDGTCFNENYFFPKNKKEKHVIDTTLLAKQYKYILPFCTLLFISLNCILYYISHNDTIFSRLNINVNCFSDIEKKPQWLILFRLFVLGASFAMVCATAVRVILATSKKGSSEYIFSAYISAMFVMSVSFTAECIHHLNIFTTVCEDVFGVRSPLIEVSEWMITVPIMIYMNVTLDVKRKEIGDKEKMLVLIAYLNIFFGFLPIMLNEVLGTVSIMISGACMIYYLYMIVMDASRAVAKYHDVDHKSYRIHEYIDYLFSHKRLFTAVMMAVIFPTYPLCYILSACKVCGHDMTSAIFAALNFLAKCCFILALMEDQLDILDPKILRMLFEKKDYGEAVKAFEKEKKLNISLLRQIFPPRVVDDLRAQRPVPAMKHPQVTIFFSDIEGFTVISSKVPALRVMKMLHELYSVMDYCACLFPTYKVETIGDAYMLVGGIFDDPEKDKDHFQHIANFAILVQACATIVKNPLTGEPIRLRMGIHSGMVKSGCVGSKMPRFCLFGDTVNTSSRMESHGEVNRIHCSEATATLLAPTGLFDISRRGEIEVKGKGKMTTYWINGASHNNSFSNRSAILKAMENAQLILESSIFISSDNTSSMPADVQEPLPILSLIPADSFKSPKSSFSMRQFLSGKKKDQIPSSPVKLNALTSVVSNDTVLAARSPSSEEPRPVPTFRSKSQFDVLEIDNTNDLTVVKAAVKSTLARPSVLYVDSDLQKIKFVEKLFKNISKNSTIVYAEHAEEALEKLKVLNNNFDVIIVAEQLSLDGFLGHEFVDVVRSNLALRSSVIIGLCSDPSSVKEEMSQFTRAGADSFWLKVQKDPKKCIKEILEKWLVRNVRLNTDDTNFNKLLAELIILFDATAEYMI